jgi:hypothetical protein
MNPKSTPVTQAKLTVPETIAPNLLVPLEINIQDSADCAPIHFIPVRCSPHPSSTIVLFHPNNLSAFLALP